jgi:hypothetical protein
LRAQGAGSGAAGAVDHRRAGVTRLTEKGGGLKVFLVRH